MLENTIKWRRDYRPDELDPEYIKPEVKSKGLGDKNGCVGVCACVRFWRQVVNWESTQRHVYAHIG